MQADDGRGKTCVVLGSASWMAATTMSRKRVGLQPFSGLGDEAHRKHRSRALDASRFCMPFDEKGTCNRLVGLVRTSATNQQTSLGVPCCAISPSLPSIANAPVFEDCYHMRLS